MSDILSHLSSYGKQRRKPLTFLYQNLGHYAPQKKIIFKEKDYVVQVTKMKNTDVKDCVIFPVVHKNSSILGQKNTPQRSQQGGRDSEWPGSI